MNLLTRVRMSIVERQLVVSACHDQIKRAERDARKDNRPVPRSQMDALQSALRDAKANVWSAEAACEGVARFPPLR